MLEVEGFNIIDFPYSEGLTLAQELDSFEGMPILLHYKDAWGKDVLAYLVDFDKTGSRWLYAKVSKEELFEYLIGSNSLKMLFSEISSEYLFLIDFDTKRSLTSAKLISKYLIPDKYLPSEESFYSEGLNDFYQNYLSKNYYLYVLRQNSFVIKVKPSDSVHQDTVGAKEASMVLAGATSSVEGYVKVKLFNLLKNEFGDSNKINNRISRTKKFLSPRVTEAAFGSFEVWLAVDTIQFHGQDKYDRKLREELIQGYKRDVLDVDFTSEEDAKIISEKFTEDERKLIYEPIIKLFENRDLVISIQDNKNRIRKEKITISEKFKTRLLPPKTVDEIVKERERKNRIFSIVVNLKEGEDVTSIKKKDLLNNLLFTEEIAETPVEFKSPLEIDGRRVELKIPLRCILSVDENGLFQIHNNTIDLFEQGTDLQEVEGGVKRQLLHMFDVAEEIIQVDYKKALELNKYLPLDYLFKNK